MKNEIKDRPSSFSPPVAKSKIFRPQKKTEPLIKAISVIQAPDGHRELARQGKEYRELENKEKRVRSQIERLDNKLKHSKEGSSVYTKRLKELRSSEERGETI